MQSNAHPCSHADGSFYRDLCYSVASLDTVPTLALPTQLAHPLLTFLSALPSKLETGVQTPCNDRLAQAPASILGRRRLLLFDDV
jgi:hypothetical protein